MLVYSQVQELLGVATSERVSGIITPRSLNMQFRTGIEPRAGLRGMNLFFEDEADRELFEHGVLQKVQPYQPYGLNPGGLAFLISGTLFFGAVSGSWLYVKKLFEGLRPDLTLAWGVQGFEWLIMQNGVDLPVIWDGRHAAFQSRPDKQEMPVGAMMCFIHHSIAVVSSDGTDKIAVSDRWRQTESDNVYKFTDTPTWASAGVFGLHISMGRIMNLMAIPQVKNTPNGDGDLLIMGSNGMQTLNLQVPVAERLNAQIQDTALVGQGSASYLGALPYRSGVWYIGHDGLQEFKRTQANFSRSDADIHESSDIQFYWDQSDSNLRPVQPIGQCDNRILLGLYPGMERNDYGFHRFHDAWASVDLSEKWRDGVRLPKRHDGLQCGIRPVEWSSLIINRVHRTYCTSWDGDGKNRVYEVTNHQTFDTIEGIPKTIVSFFDTPPLTGPKKAELVVKRPTHLRLDYEDASGNVILNAQVRGENETCWHDWGEACAKPSADCSTPCELAPPHRGTKVIGDPISKPCFDPPPNSLRARILIEGRARVRWVLAGMAISDGPSIDGFPAELFSKSCGSCEEGSGPAFNCCEDLNLYNIRP